MNVPMLDRPCTPLVIAGVHVGGDAYPNAHRTLEALRESGVAEIIERGLWLPESFRLWQLMRERPLRRLSIMCALWFGNLYSVFRSLPAARRLHAPVYVPYPAVPFLWLCSWIPRALRPTLIADAFISMWDSLVIDRAGAAKAGIAARCLHALESRALRTADVVLADTEANARYLEATFALRPGSVRAIPLAIVEPSITPEIAEAPFGKFLRVLYVGTLIPLHGIETLLRGISPLLDDPRFEFVIVGDGQDASVVEAFRVRYPHARLVWERRWQDAAQVERWIQSAQICLGVFGGAGKAGRVLPFKLYLYLANGRCIVTQTEMSLPADVPVPPVIRVNPDDPDSITEALSRLADNVEEVRTASKKASEYYWRYLSNHRVADVWKGLLHELLPR